MIQTFEYLYPEAAALLQQAYREGRKIGRIHISRSVTRTPERNDPCPCGSGKKYKRCCQ